MNRPWWASRRIELSIMTKFNTIRRRADIAVVAPMPRNATVAMRTERDERPVEDT